ncbi:hypothetical protein [Acidianus bottle-shaped virus]|uniref:Uncharacterized protein ORF56 n=1 Tax=Acidianus bottle-shaped virus (isolate Italy/Pozzuoli) TaxID=654911 RepID=Y056_ABVP|nr:hypothetical protein ABV_gp13 [Acidianus bottle-shaped virus]A4ZU99.1 RecName: Full=Uncharacterized protein ORF56 [Acidianus bottle-shaped virus (isolate Pozzuoli)]ABP73403.1 hypothetical protein [Acidianus bottle-shaped virus]
MRDECYQVYLELKKILDKAMECLNDEDFQLLLVTMIAKATLTKVEKNDLQRRIPNK